MPHTLAFVQDHSAMPAACAARHNAFIVVGCGPVGAVTALLLAASGRSVLVLEAATAVYPLPRAVHIDAHSARILATVLPASAVASLLTPMQHCTFSTADGRRLLRFSSRTHRSHGLCSDFIIDQPELERALRDRFATHPNLTLLQDETVTDVHEPTNGAQHRVRVTTASGTTYTSDYVLACDGAHSTVRSLLDIPMLSLASASGFTATHWWVINGLMSASAKQQCSLTELGVTQVCDPMRPLTIVYLPGERVRVEVRRQIVDGHLEQCTRSATSGWPHRVWDGLCYLLLVVWSAVAPLISSSWSAWRVQPVARRCSTAQARETDDTCPPPLDTLLPSGIPADVFTSVRCAAYTMHSLLADSFMSHSRRVLLLGDAAHLTPPYLGQALCLGIRDAASLAFRIAHASSTDAATGALVEWEAERRAEAAEITVRSGKVGQMMEVRGTWQCRLRDVVMRCIKSSEKMKAAFQTEVAVYGRVLYARGRQKLLVWPQNGDSDAVLLRFPAVSIIGIDCDARQLVAAQCAHRHGRPAPPLHFARLDTSSGGANGRWRDWLASVGLLGAGVAVVRPDGYLLGIYSVRGQQSGVRDMHSFVSSRSPLIYCDLPFSIFHDLRKTSILP